MKSNCARVLLIDNNVDDQYIEKLALAEVLPASSTIYALSSGDAAVAYMIGEGKFADRTKYPFPTLIITDLKMENGDGFDVLEFLEANPAWNVVPRIMFSDSNDMDDVRTAYVLGASAFHTKPKTWDKMKQQMRTIVEYWGSSEVPPVDESGRALPTNSRGRIGARYAVPVAGPEMIRP